MRPEPDYWVAAVASESVRTERVMEALHHAPRPAVLYVTEVAEAEAWRQRLFAAGFRRLRKLDGKTSRTDVRTSSGSGATAASTSSSGPRRLVSVSTTAMPAA